MKVNKLFSYILTGILVITLLYISQNLKQKSLWYDEAGQFFIAKGLNHDSEPFAKEKGLKQVIENNANYNLDPGGFSILLYFWTKVSNSSEWLRVLPFVFFLGFLFCWIYLFYSWFDSINIALLSSFIPLISRSAFINLGFEIRAYSMECLGTLLCVIALSKLNANITNKGLLLWSSVFAFFITSRYSEVIVVFVASLIIIYFIYSSKASLKEKIFFCIVYATPLFISLSYIVLAAQIHQNKYMVPLDYVYYISRDYKELATTANFLFLIILFGLTGLLFFRNKYQRIKKHETLLIFTVAVNVFFIVLSAFGLYPWSPENQRCISLYLLVNICAIVIVVELMFNLFSRTGNVKYYLMMVGLVFVLFLRRDSFFGRQHLENRENFYAALTEINLKKYKKIFVESRSSSPSIRYLFEYGALKSRKDMGYPEKFIFGKFPKHNIIKGGETEKEYFDRQPKMNTYLEYDMMITPELYRYGDNDKWEILKGTNAFYVKK